MTDETGIGVVASSDAASAVLISWRTGVRWALAGPVVTVGRSATVDVRLPNDPLVSRVHARLEWVACRWSVVDDGLSRNGTFVNGRRLTGRRVLHDGDEVRIGSTLLRFCVVEDDEPTTLAVDAPLTAARLTPAQRAVLVALCRPFARGGDAAPASNIQIAEELVVSVDTVKTHLRVLSAKLGLRQLPPVQKRLRLVDVALRTGLVTMHDLAERSRCSTL